MEKKQELNGFDFIQKSLTAMLIDSINGEPTEKKHIEAIVDAVNAERKDRENNPGVWDGAPEWATTAHIQWTNGQYNYRTSVADHAEWREKPYTRTLPKTKAREIAERVSKENCTFSPEYTVSLWADIIESAINEAQKGGK